MTSFDPNMVINVEDYDSRLDILEGEIYDQDARVHYLEHYISEMHKVIMHLYSMVYPEEEDRDVDVEVRLASPNYE